MDMGYWYYFLSLEKDLIRTIDYVALCPDNSGAYSDNFAKLLLAIGSEVDVISKALCGVVAQAERAQNIDDYRRILTAAYSGIDTVEIEIPRTRVTYSPWASWGYATPENPAWWKAYNCVKHNRVVNFHLACQSNVVEALTGLLAFNLYWYRSIGDLIDPRPLLLDRNFPPVVVHGPSIPLPGT